TRLSIFGALSSPSPRYHLTITWRYFFTPCALQNSPRPAIRTNCGRPEMPAEPLRQNGFQGAYRGPPIASLSLTSLHEPTVTKAHNARAASFVADQCTAAVAGRA